MGLKFVYNNEIQENRVLEVSELASPQYATAPLKLFDTVNPYSGTRRYTPFYTSKDLYTLAYEVTSSGPRMYVNTSSPTFTVFYKNKKLYAAKAYPDGQVLKSSYLRKLTYDANGGVTPSTTSASIWTDIGNKTATIKLDSTTSKEGYTFAGWNTNADGTGTLYKNGSSFNLSEDVTLYAAWQSNYDIPAGTYSPSQFQNLISNYISVNSSRTVANSFTATVNNQTITVSKGDSVSYISSYSDSERHISFRGSTSALYTQSADRSEGFSEYKNYVTCIIYNSSTPAGYSMFGSYNDYSITIGTGISFN